MSFENDKTNYDAYIVGEAAFDYAAEQGIEVPEGWKTFDGHVTMSAPNADRVELDVRADVRAIGVVKTGRSLALVVTVDGQTVQPGTTTPLHITLATAPKGNGHYPPVVAGQDVSEALATMDDRFTQAAPASLPAVAAPAGSSREHLPAKLVEAASGKFDRAKIDSLLASGISLEAVAAAVSQHAPAPRTIRRAMPQSPTHTLTTARSLTN